uniref:Zinc finger, CCHC-type n=1 Tax=Tanacetum cinerariifolium TaxID=118510 RepID=A0A6L2KP29_TANCI|nr:zinc finger, CCHC-type [Tanacetum cinerariifolium]
MHFLLSNMSVVHVMTTHIPEDGDDATVEQLRKRAKWDNDDYVCRGLILNVMEQYNELLGILERFTQHKMNMDEAIQVSCIIDKLPLSWKYFKYTFKHLKEELTLAELGSHLRIEESLRVQDSDKPKGNNVVGISVVNMVEHNNSSRYNDNKGKRKHHDNIRAFPNKKAIPTCWKCRKSGHIKKDCKGVNVGNKANGSSTKSLMDGSSNSLKGATVHVCKDRRWFKTYESLNDGYILHMGNELTALMHGRDCIDLRFSSGKIVLLFNVLHVPNIRKNLVSSSILNNCGYKQLIESNKFALSKHGVFIGFGYLSNQMSRLNIVNDNISSAFMSTSKLNDSILRHARLDHVHFTRMQSMSKDGLIPAFDMDTKKFSQAENLPSLDNVKMDDPNITMEEYIRLEEEKAQRHGRTFNWQTATFKKVKYYKDEDDCFIDFETKFPAIVFDNTLTSDTALPCEPTVSSTNKNMIDFRISLDESDDEDYTVIFNKNSFSYKIIYVNDLKMDSKNDNGNNDMPSSPKTTVNYLDDLDCFNDFKNEFPAIVYNDGLTSKSDLKIEPPVSDSSPLDVIFPNDPKTIKDSNDKTQPSGKQRHPWLKYQVEGYTEDIVHDYKHRLETIWGKSVNRVHILDFEHLTPKMRHDLAMRLMMVYTKGDGQQEEDAVETVYSGVRITHREGDGRGWN